MQRQEYQKPPVASLDFNDHLRQAYWNAENSLNLFQTEGGTSFPGAPELGSRFEAKVAWEKFEGNVKILVAMVKGTPSLKDDTTLKTALLPKKKKEKRLTREAKQQSEIDSSYEPEEGDYEDFTVEVAIDYLETFSAVTELFHRKLIFKPAVTVYGGHL